MAFPKNNHRGRRKETVVGGSHEPGDIVSWCSFYFSIANPGLNIECIIIPKSYKTDRLRSLFKKKKN